MAPRVAKKTDSRLAARLAAIASLGAAVIHFAVVPTHWQAWMPSGLFFLSMALFQLIWARVVLAGPATAVLAAGIAANVGAAALWVLSRTAGAPFGPNAGEPELIQAAGLCALLLEIYVVMGAGWVWYRGRQPEAISAVSNAIVLLGASAVIAAAATAGVASSVLNDDHHSSAGAEQDFHPPINANQGSHPEPVAPPNTDLTPPSTAPADVESPTPAADPSHGTDGDHHSE
ncbi:hypothetical protein [Mycolicibacterium arseniciresistens]|uniref:Transmembrane protein n=1 Tax=Mycolicibacterium arseniciresistens TaxID=3062257 RepID=A0ABT8UCJ8_9MYCO|nr:hypothetical protein [Mycolicibacterium arseniciresistens]MDO3634585.1 hypothetical protein [Mycolicibacterium arseniciresistens]